ncbi:hypothetical protein Taro_007553 [Colocasia esculenta]|uniref:Uncharacterized protein n=1 Tax=Colocasia esculenta TaxID=4460 RepID=A0A843TRK9_COLES|nr:hypothetical protein [Colocasia esculenta]
MLCSVGVVARAKQVLSEFFSVGSGGSVVSPEPWCARFWLLLRCLLDEVHCLIAPCPGRDSLSQEFVVGRLRWWLVPPCVASSNPGFDFSQAQFSGNCPDPGTFMGGIRSMYGVGPSAAVLHDKRD